MGMLGVAIAAARAGGAVLQDALGAEIDPRMKTDEAGEQSIVTIADTRADTAIQAVIRAAAPDHFILSEEGVFRPEGAEHLWVIDPLDGTDDFSRGCPTACVAVAYAYRGQPQAAAVYDPFRDELFTAQRGAGATLNGRPIQAGPVERLADAVVAISSPDRRRSDAAYRETVAVTDELMARVQRVRIYGATALEICWIACGRLDGKISLRGRVWDFMAPALVLEEAGGLCRDLRGDPIALDTVGAVATNGPIQAEMADLVSRALAAIQVH